VTPAPRSTAALEGEIEAKPLHSAAPIGPYRAYRSLLSPQRVRELSVLRPWRTVFDTLHCWLAILGGFALGAWSLSTPAHWLWGVPLAVVIIGARYYALFILGHDGMHRRIFSSGPSSELYTDLLLIGPIAMVCRVNARNHLDHHQHLATDDDPDLHKHACFNKTTRSEYLAFLTGLSSVVGVLRNLFVRPFKAAAITESQSGPSRYRPRDLAIILTWQLALSGGLTLLVALARGADTPLDILARGWFAYPLFWLLPVYLFTYLPNLIRSFVEHSHPENDDRADTHRLITFTSNPIERFFLSPMNMNYHIAHHLWPSIPYYNLPIADAELRGRPGTDGLTWRRSYTAYLWRYFVALPLAECRQIRHRAKRA
jgi:fatty acid desaturase